MRFLHQQCHATACHASPACDRLHLLAQALLFIPSRSPGPACMADSLLRGTTYSKETLAPHDTQLTGNTAEMAVGPHTNQTRFKRSASWRQSGVTPTARTEK